MHLRPLGDKVIVERIDADKRTPGGIVLPDSAKKKPTRGRVKAVGPGRILDDGRRSEMEVKEGNEVVFTSYAGMEVQLNHDEFIVMNQSDILAVVE